MGRAPGESRRRRPEPQWVPDPGATHPSQGHFETIDDPEPVRAAPLELVPVDDAAAIVLADEIKRLSRPA